mmetsp:Transcript_987/g.1781  ORF Transcript_987/g.1781 Transcript_987/m.1781 type:complete len:217 (-) Transcript_987:48-698(-)
MDDLALVDVAAHDLGDADGISVDLGLAAFAHGAHASLYDEGSKEALVAELLGGEDGGDDALKLLGIPSISDGLRDELGQRLLQELVRLLVSHDDLRSVKSHPKEVLAHLEQLPRKGHGEVRGVPALLLLHLRCELEHLGGRVLYLKFLDDRGAVGSDDDFLEVVDNEFIHTIRAQGRTNNPSEALCSLNIAKRGTVNAFHVLVPSLQHTGEAGSRV